MLIELKLSVFDSDKEKGPFIEICHCYVFNLIPPCPQIANWELLKKNWFTEHKLFS